MTSYLKVNDGLLIHSDQPDLFVVFKVLNCKYSVA